MSKTILDDVAYQRALEWARELDEPGFPNNFPDVTRYVELAAQNADIDVDAFDADENLFHALPEEYELAYQQVKLERQKKS
ncbi:hypothetical protein [Desulfovibrio inopinatus]|uniref:hypothetical protein n=1 Tax=Desulfovibrio inopinatus TaxID=102109 RepID=UPI00040C518E|nr:hypothetical protein [Desulfovibrio inopinatus]